MFLFNFMQLTSILNYVWHQAEQRRIYSDIFSMHAAFETKYTESQIKANQILFVTLCTTKGRRADNVSTVMCTRLRKYPTNAINLVVH